MLKRRKVQTILYPYDHMRDAILKGYNRRRWLIIAGLVSTFSAGLGLLLSIVKPSSTGSLVTSIFYGFFGFSCTILVMLMTDNMMHTDMENKLIPLGIEFLRGESFHHCIVEAIEKRAEVGNSAVSTRTLIPILILPITLPVVIPLVLMQTSIPLEIIFVTGAVLFFLAFSFVREIDRANIDAIIKQACIEYWCEQQLSKSSLDTSDSITAFQNGQDNKCLSTSSQVFAQGNKMRTTHRKQRSGGRK